MLIIGRIHPGHPDGAFRRKKQGIEMLGQRRLAAPVMTENGGKLTVTDLQIHTPDGMRHLCLFTVIRVRLIIVPHIVNADNVAIFFLIFFSYAVFHHFSHCPAVFSAKFMI